MSNMSQFDNKKIDISIAPAAVSNDVGGRSQQNSEATMDRRQPKVSPTVLIADDDIRFADVIAAQLREIDLNTLVANDGDLALALAIVKKPDVIVLDSRMPKRSGYLVLEYLRTVEGLSVPIIMLSDNEGERHEQYARMLGVSEFLQKPLEADRVVKVITETMMRS